MGLFTAAFAAALPSSQIVIGCTYNSDGQLVRQISPADSGALEMVLHSGRSGAGIAMPCCWRIHLVFLSERRFAKLIPAIFKQADGVTALPPLTTFSGVYQNTLQDDYGYDGMMCWRVSTSFSLVTSSAGQRQHSEAQDQ